MQAIVTQAKFSKFPQILAHGYPVLSLFNSKGKTERSKLIILEFTVFNLHS
jgi:hypothetical protein